MNGKKIVSIFSGIDALGLGFKEDFDVTLAVEQEKHACQTLRDNKEAFFPDMTVWERDIFSITDGEILKWKGCEGLIGGPSCQPFSAAKHGFDPNDTRIQGLTEYLRWLRLLTPKFFLFENTAGMMQGKKKIFYDHFKEEAEKLGYRVEGRIVNAHDYGNAQNRKRMISIGFREDLDLDFIFPEPVPESERKYVRDIITKKGEEVGPTLQYSETRRRIVSYVPPGGHWRQLPTDELKIEALGEKNFYTPQGGMTGAYRRLHPDSPCPTLTTNPCQRNTMLTTPYEDRPLSIKSYKRGMGLPDDYILSGPLSAQYKAVGNAVPVELSHQMCKSIVNLLSSTQNEFAEAHYTLSESLDVQVAEAKTNVVGYSIVDDQHRDNGQLKFDII